LKIVVVDEGSGISASRVAAGLFNPLTGPRFTPDTDDWDQIVPFYRHAEALWRTHFLHLLPLFRPWEAGITKTVASGAPGWSARSDNLGVWIEGGGWVDLPKLLETARDYLYKEGVLEERQYSPDEGRGRTVWWCGGLADLKGPVWGSVDGVAGRWQGVRGDLLTVRIPGLHRGYAEVGKRFLLPLGDGFYRWGATHESDVLDTGPRPEARSLLENELSLHPAVPGFTVTSHEGGVRPASRTGRPLVVPHPDEPGWTLFNGFGGRGVSWIPRWLGRLKT
jgi:glycine/D-amino acid oxidase-like deaminating enzyme